MPREQRRVDTRRGPCDSKHNRSESKKYRLPDLTNDDRNEVSRINQVCQRSLYVKRKKEHLCLAVRCIVPRALWVHSSCCASSANGRQHSSQRLTALTAPRARLARARSRLSGSSATTDARAYLAQHNKCLCAGTSERFEQLVFGDLKKTRARAICVVVSGDGRDYCFNLLARGWRSSLNLLPCINASISLFCKGEVSCSRRTPMLSSSDNILDSPV